MELQEESVKIIYQDKTPIGCMKQNGTLKFYKWIECSYGDIDQLFNKKSVDSQE